jgi:hypothetical protein
VHVVEEEWPRRGSLTTTQEAVRDDVVALGARHGIHVTVAVRRGVEPARAILRAGPTSGARLLVLGAERRIGARLSLGKTVNTLTGAWRGDLVVLVS